MSANVLLMIFATALMMLLCALFWAVCLIAGAAHPLRSVRRPVAVMSDIILPAAILTWRRRPKTRLRGSSNARRSGVSRRSAHSLWRQ